MSDVDLFQLIRRDPDGPALVAALAGIPDVHVVNGDRQTLLHAAIAHLKPQAAAALLRSGIDPNAQDAHGMTPLHYSTLFRNDAIAERLLSAGADPSLVDQHGNSPLWGAVLSARGDYGLVKRLLARGARPLATRKNRHDRSPVDFVTLLRDRALLDLLTSEPSWSQPPAGGCPWPGMSAEVSLRFVVAIMATESMWRRHPPETEGFDRPDASSLFWLRHPSSENRDHPAVTVALLGDGATLPQTWPHRAVAMPPLAPAPSAAAKRASRSG